jgi:hypothetical protein
LSFFQYFFLHRDWYSSHEKATINPSNDTISILPPGAKYCIKKDQHIFYYNVFEELDSPGEFYVNRTTGQLFFWPPTPITGDSDVLVSVTGGVFININGASNVVIKGMENYYLLNYFPILSLILEHILPLQVSR